MGARNDLPLVALVLLACATALMALAAAAGVASFGLALRATLGAVAQRTGPQAGPGASPHAPSRDLAAGASRKEAS